ncbi:phosphate ABC transporter substrate-binding protein PstS family protein [bacterium]|nr:phosphate ABC transporter substrate-binding protein PstS family protein [bacterium]
MLFSSNARGAGRWALSVCVLALGFTGCEKVDSNSAPSGSTTEAGSSETMDATPSTIVIDGSSTVYPISQAIAEVFHEQHEHVEITVTQSGTGGGMKKFVVNELDICDASRPIKQEEIDKCAEHGIEFLELEVAIDGLSVVVNPQNDWVECITIAELKKIWAPDSKVTKWSEVNPAWPDEPIALYGADTDSGTFEYFTEVVNGKAKASRTEYTYNSDDNLLVQGVADGKYSLGYFGYGYYAENKDKLKALSIKKDDSSECVAPTPETIEMGTYAPMARPLFIYINKAALKRSEVADFAKFYLTEEGQKLVTDQAFVRLPADKLAAMQERLAEALK